MRFHGGVEGTVAVSVSATLIQVRRMRDNELFPDEVQYNSWRDLNRDYSGHVQKYWVERIAQLYFRKTNLVLFRWK